MRAVIEGFRQPAVQPYIEEDQTHNVILRHHVCFYSIDPAFTDDQEVDTKVSPNDNAVLVRSKVTDQVIARCEELYGVGTLVKQDILLPDLSKG